jgi:hypothetical protein
MLATRPIPLESFVLDAKDLAASGKKVAVIGNYQKLEGGAEYLCHGLKPQCGTSVPLLTVDAPRALRAYLMRAWDAIPEDAAMFGGGKVWFLPDLVLLGHAENCMQLWNGIEREGICLVVENGWHVQGPHTRFWAPTFTPPEWQPGLASRSLLRLGAPVRQANNSHASQGRCAPSRA